MRTNIPHYRKIALILTALLAVIALFCLLWILSHQAEHFPNSSQSLTADIYQNGVLLQSISLSDVEESYSFTITGENGCQNEIEVRPGSIGILSADCPDKLCVHQGFINSSLLPITCLPNHLVIQIRTENTLDIITY